MALDFQRELKELEDCEPLPYRRIRDASQSDWLFTVSDHACNNGDAFLFHAPADSTPFSPKLSDLSGPSARGGADSRRSRGSRVHEDPLLVRCDVSSSSAATLDGTLCPAPAAALTRVPLAKRRSAKKQETPRSKGHRPAAAPTAAQPRRRNSGGPDARRRRSSQLGASQGSLRAKPTRESIHASGRAEDATAAAAWRSREASATTGLAKQLVSRPRNTRPRIDLRSFSTRNAASSSEIVVSPETSIETAPAERVGSSGRRISAGRALSRGGDVVELVDIVPIDALQRTVSDRCGRGVSESSSAAAAVPASISTRRRAGSGVSVPASRRRGTEREEENRKEEEEENRRQRRWQEEVKENTGRENNGEVRVEEEKRMRDEEVRKRKGNNKLENKGEKEEACNKLEELSTKTKRIGGPAEVCIMGPVKKERHSEAPSSTSRARSQQRSVSPGYGKKYVKYRANKKCCAVM